MVRKGGERCDREVGEKERMMAVEKIWLDVDTSNGEVMEGRVRDVDDGLALAFAFGSPEVEVRGVSVVFGNVGLEVAGRVTREVMRRIGRGGMEVHDGAGSGADLGRETAATRALEKELEGTGEGGEGGLTIVALGPVTNVATVVMRRPELRGRIREIVLCAGRRTGFDFHVPGKPGLKFPDANFEKDVPGTQVLLDSGVRLVFAGYESSCDTWLTRRDVEEIGRRGAGGKWFAETSEAWLSRWETGLKLSGFNPFDVVTVGWVTHRGIMGSHLVRGRIVRGPDDRGEERLVADRKEKAYLVCDPVEEGVGAKRAEISGEIGGAAGVWLGGSAGEHVYVTRAEAGFAREVVKRICAVLGGA